jgi:tripartite-type tricarboxylate transporter receptor subunit TctC
VKKDSPLDSIEAVKQMGRPITYGATGPSSTSYIATTIVSDALAIPYEVVTGYAGSSEYILGVIRGDVDAAFANLSTVRPYLDSGEVKALAIIGADSTDPAIPDATALGIPQLNNITVVRMLGASPGLPAEIKATLENAVRAAVNDPGFQDWLKQTGNELHYADAAATTAAVADMAGFYENFKQQLQ